MMNIVAISASPLMQKGNTELILAPFLEGAAEGGASIEQVYLRKLKIRPCLGDIGCWVKTPGKCIQDDDMQNILPHMKMADTWVLATPLYMDGMTGTLKNLLDRLAPLASPFIDVHEGHHRHVVRDPTVPQGRIVLIANCGFWESDNFDPLIRFMEAFCRNMRRDFAGALLRPHGPAMRLVEGERTRGVASAAKAAGLALARSGRIPEDLARGVARPLLSRDEYMDRVNTGFEEILNARGLK